MKYCGECGNQLKDDDLFCGECGAQQANVNTNNNCCAASCNTTLAQQPAQHSSEFVSGASKSIPGWIVLFTLVSCFPLFLAYWLADFLWFFQNLFGGVCS